MIRIIRFVLCAGMAFAGSAIALPELASADGSIIVQPHLAGGRGRTPNNETEYKVRDSDGNLVARGWITHEDDDHNVAVVDGLPAGDYTIETYSDRDDGTRLGGRTNVKLEDGQQRGQQVDMDPLTPVEDLTEQVEDLEDRIEQDKQDIDHIEEDIADHVRRGEDDAVDQHEAEIERIKDNIKRRKKALRKKRAALNRLRRAGKKPPAKTGPPTSRPETPSVDVPPLPRLPPLPDKPGAGHKSSVPKLPY